MAARVLGAVLKTVLNGGLGVPGSRDGQQLLVLVLLEGQPVFGVDVLRTPRLVLEPALHGLPQLLVGGEPRGERHVREADVEAREQLLERAQTLQLSRPIETIAGAGARGC